MSGSEAPFSPPGTAGERYFAAAKAVLAEIWETQSAAIEGAASAIAETLQRGGLIFISGSGHSHMLAEELFYRAGGLAAVVPLLESSLMLHEGATKSSAIERLEGYAAAVLENAGLSENDLLIVASNSGRNAYPVELAIEARKRSCTTIAITSLATASRVTSRHSSGETLSSVADLVLDNCVSYGDAAVGLEGLKVHVGPLSTIAGVAIVNAAVARAIELCLENGHVPQVFESANLQEVDRAGSVDLTASSEVDLDHWRTKVRML